jgi:hypothetical protein
MISHLTAANRAIQNAATQWIDGVLTLPTSPNTATIEMGPYAFPDAGTYVLFDYSKSASVTPLIGDPLQLIADGTALVACSNPVIFPSYSERKIYVQTSPGTSNGTQYIDGTLTISGPTTIFLSPELYGAPGTYVLFSYASLVGSITDLVISPTAGRRVDTSIAPNGCAVVGSTITVTLI